MYEFKKLNESIYYVLGNKSEPCPKLSLVVGKDFSLLLDVGNKEEQVKSLFNGIKEYNLPPIKYVVIWFVFFSHREKIVLCSNIWIELKVVFPFSYEINSHKVDKW